jgi:hypothetical protein
MYQLSSWDWELLQSGDSVSLRLVPTRCQPSKSPFKSLIMRKKSMYGLLPLMGMCLCY